VTDGVANPVQQRRAEDPFFRSNIISGILFPISQSHSSEFFLVFNIEIKPDEKKGSTAHDLKPPTELGTTNI
jgi:hypothetical protein